MITIIPPFFGRSCDEYLIKHIIDYYKNQTTIQNSLSRPLFVINLAFCKKYTFLRKLPYDKSFGF